MVYSIVYTGSLDGSISQDIRQIGHLGATEVLVRVTAAALCHRDSDYQYEETALGHEGAGVVEELGGGVQDLTVGDRVVWGYQQDYCGACTSCRSDKKSYCRFTGTATERLSYGALATHAVLQERLLFKIPEQLTDLEAASLMCSGSTVYSALKRANLAPGAIIAVYGMGGLGHLAVQFAAKQGHPVVVLSGDPSKRQDAFTFGASEFRYHNGQTTPTVASHVHALLVTASSVDASEWLLLAKTMAIEGTILILSLLSSMVEIPAQEIVARGLTLQGCFAASHQTVIEMLSFAAHNGVRPKVKEYKMTEEGIAEALRNLASSDVRYRAVLTPSNER